MGKDVETIDDLADELGRLLLDWDRGTVSSVVDTIAQSGRQEIQGIVEAYLPPDLVVRSAANIAINSFLKARDAEQGALQRKAAEAAEANSKSSPAAPGGNKVMGIFKQGGKIKTAGGSKASGTGTGAGTAVAPTGEERLVVNCLGCGRIFDRRNTTNPDVIKFLERKGQCTFCGRQVSLTRSPFPTTTSPAAAPAPPSPSPSVTPSPQRATTDTASLLPSTANPDATASPGALASTAADAAAVAFKNRLVQYDRESAKRTQVIDDQSDYFELETNAWLSDSERQQMRERRRVEQEAEAARRQRVAITIDLMGRRVLVADAANTLNNAAPSFRTGGDEVLGAYDPRAVNTKGAMWEASKEETARAAAQQQVSTDDPGALQHVMQRSAQDLRNLRATANPNIPTSAPRFVRQAAPSHANKGSSSSHARANGHAPNGSRTGPQVPRLQDNLAEVFDEFETQVLHSEVEAAILAAEASTPFDLCPPEYVGLAPPPAPTSLPTLEREVTDPAALPPGMVLLRGWLSLAVQEELVRALRELGSAQGGFYQPTYGHGRVMHLRMMCLGLHWEPRTHSYERVRVFDGCAPPALPARFQELCAQALNAASQQAEKSQGVTLPSLSPDICLVNYYDKTGRLGLHQDRDETSESLRRGTPVVSFSIGDTCDFLFGMGPDEENAQAVRLKSGDVLVFGGPARMVFHGVPAIYPGTAPAQLVYATGLRPGRINMTFRQL